MNKKKKISLELLLMIMNKIMIILKKTKLIVMYKIKNKKLMKMQIIYKLNKVFQ